MWREDGRETRVVVLGEPHGEYIELVITWEHGIEGREIAERLLDDLRSRVHKDSMYNWRDFSKLFRAASGQ
jgi:hypothetical protein